jgi:hypothetical protein
VAAARSLDVVPGSGVEGGVLAQESDGVLVGRIGDEIVDLTALCPDAGRDRFQRGLVPAGQNYSAFRTASSLAIAVAMLREVP